MNKIVVHSLEELLNIDTANYDAGTIFELIETASYTQIDPETQEQQVIEEEVVTQYIINDAYDGSTTDSTINKFKAYVPPSQFNIGDSLVYNEEFIKVEVDSEDQILYAVTTDGQFIFGGGIPPQIKDHLQGITDDIMIDITDLENTTTRLNEIFPKDVQNKEFSAVWLDENQHIIMGIFKDGNIIGKLNY